MKIRKLIWSIAIVVLAVAFSITVAMAISSVGKEAANARGTVHVSNPVAKITIARGAAANTAFLAAGVDYGDVLLQAMKYDTVAASVDWTDIPLDSIYWQDKTYDTLACGLATTPYLLILYYDLTD